jgi:hypothetical protein
MHVNRDSDCTGWVFINARSGVEELMTRILAVLFPPELPQIDLGQINPCKLIDVEDYDESGIVAVREKPYRDGIERFFAEEGR